MTNAYLEVVSQKVKESNLSDVNSGKLLDWIREQDNEFIKFLASDDFEYNEIHLHTEKSLLDGVGSVEDYIAQAKKLKHRALAVTDHGVTHNWYNLRQAEKPVTDKEGNVLEEGLIPIYGCEVYLNFKDKVHHFLLLAENTIGYQNILKIVSESHHNKSDTSSRHPNCDIETLKKYNEGVIATSACIGGVIGQHILGGSDWSVIVEDTKLFAEIYQDRFYLEIQDYEVEDENELEDFQIEFLEKQRRANDSVIRLANELDLPLVATNDCHYPKKGDHIVQDILLSIRTKDKLDNPERFRFQSYEHYMKDKWEMLWKFKDTPEAVYNTWKIANRCKGNIEYQEEYLLPVYPYLPENTTASEFFEKSVNEGIKEYYSKEENFKPLLDKFQCTPEELWGKIKERADFEVSVLQSMGFEGYMQIVSWINELARENDILIGPGRGSAAGSIIALALKITAVCPLRFDLLFERFLNPDRIEMPDIDIDYQYERRPELIDLVREELGDNKVAQIATFGKMKARAALRDVGRVLGTNTFLVDKMAKLVPFGNNLKKTLEGVPSFRNEYNKNPEAKELVDFALMVEGKPKNYSVHAAGIILSRDDIRNHASFQKGKKAIAPVIQSEMDDVDGLRLVKQDFLGLRNLSVISKAIDFIKERHNIDIDPYKIPKDDPKTYELLASGESIACFQLESQGMRQLLQDIQVEELEDVIDCIALYRPGVLSVGMHHEYVRNKFNPEGVSYIHPKMEEILAPTRGIMIYQEQAMLIANKLAGFSMADADVLRKAIGHLNEKLMADLKDKFIEGCAKVSNIPEKTAGEIWHLIEVMAAYSFNKSHSVAYSFISVDTAYLKANYPIEYMCSAITLAAQGNSPKTPLYIEEAKRMGIKVIAPDINKSNIDFDIKEDQIIFGLSAIRDVGKGASLIVQERNKNGPYKSITDFRKRVKVNKRVVRALMKAGCFDSLGINRFSLLEKLEEVIKIKPEKKQETNTEQLSLLPDFDELDSNNIIFPDIDGPTDNEIADLEIEMCGIYITHHPLSTYQEDLYKTVTVTAEEFETQEEEALVITGGLIKEKKVVVTKRQQEMAILTIDDLTETYSVVVFPRQYEKLKEFEEKDIVLLKGRIQYREKFGIQEDDEVEYEIQVIAEDMILFEKQEDVQKLGMPIQKQTRIQNEQQMPKEQPKPPTNRPNALSLSEYLNSKGNPKVTVV